MDDRSAPPELPGTIAYEWMELEFVRASPLGQRCFNPSRRMESRLNLPNEEDNRTRTYGGGFTRKQRQVNSDG
jgi:hypothetical protein